ncbi:MAG: BREX-2 system adenine-specific DNA-methyltransferase PglX [Hydrogenophaga sp.]|uniref:BREX-2 system adenine-specific DNA-methyltransferase PglX n=1 Tax=Hydrogenophaga sp. TaxID=1904254 RepID=UPI0027325729|nr:BREX-2 system adenine-specific DNA-methyltransferase PglX [Hydrogenophaga sp.]MDP3627242.1 BREX-2 system adenine-specific DNA-methyltransferase PglX [Hydrogenophaga sp.]
MIDAKVLLTDLTRLLKRLEDDLRERALSPSSEVPELRGQLQAEWQAARDAERTAETFESWAEQVITQAGVHWLLSCVFLRFIEDNGLVDRPWISGTPQSGRLALARDSHDAHFRAHPHQNDRDFLIASFREAGALPGLHTFFDEAHNPVFRLGISGDAAMAVMQFWQDVAADSGLLVRDFTDSTWNTRFLGDLYQDLSEATRKRYALLQTPEFVEEFILNRTLTPAIQEFGYRETRLIDPTCGSGHFLLGAFYRLVEEWARNEPGRNPTDVAQKALDAVAGVDLNPFAVAIARFRLLLAALQVSQVQRLANAPDFKINVAIGDSLLHGTRFGGTESQELFDAAASHADTGLAHAYASEDLANVQRILGVQYHAVVGNPPYIVVKDAALNAAYRLKYASCHMKYSLGAPFTQRFFELAVQPVSGSSSGHGAGYVGLITANSFMKREFGSKLIEQVLPRLDLTHVVDTSGAYIPGHGTPTVILFGRHRPPMSESVRTVMGIKGEPSAPEDPAQGLVWKAITGQIDQVGSESDFVSVADSLRETFGKHPWSIGGGGAADVKDCIEAQAHTKLGTKSQSIGFMAITGEDDAFLIPRHIVARLGAPVRSFVLGDAVRDWTTELADFVAFPYVQEGEDFSPAPLIARSWYCRVGWNNRSFLRSRVMFGKTAEQHGNRWDQYMQFIKSRVASDSLIAFAEVATHNHFVLDRGGRVFKQTAPVIKLPAGSSESEHLGLLGLLNSSIGCFWLKQVCFNKGNGGIGGGISDEKWELRYAHNASQVADFPLVAERPIDIALRIDVNSRQLGSLQPAALLARATLPTRAEFDATQEQAARLRRLMVADQEELDWRCYRLYGLLPVDTAVMELEHEAPVEVSLGERAFEILLARRMAAGTETTTWFERHGSVPITEIPAHWPEAYRRVVQRRIELIENEKSIGLIERPEFKRRWNSSKWEDLEHSALRDWLLGRLEAPALWPASGDQPPQLISADRLADAVQHDAEFMQVAALYAGRTDFQLPQLVSDLVTTEAVPFLPVLRYADSGLRKREQWEATWALQRHEDRIDAEVEAEAPGWREELQSQAANRFGSSTTPEAIAWVEDQLAKEIAQQKVERKENEVGKIPVPPKYQSKDFLKADVWRLRGGLDVPKERWVSYPSCERGADGSLPIAWAGWDHLQQAMALASYFIDMKEREGWSPERLQPLLAGLLELLPWLKQWHNEMNPDFGARMGDYYESFVTDEARALQFTLDDLRAWKPPVTAVRRGRRRAA